MWWKTKETKYSPDSHTVHIKATNIRSNVVDNIILARLDISEMQEQHCLSGCACYVERTAEIFYFIFLIDLNNRFQVHGRSRTVLRQVFASHLLSPSR